MSAIPCLALAALLSLGVASRLGAGDNAGAEAGLATITEPCGLVAGETIDFYVATRGMVAVRQIKFHVSWRPTDAVAAVEAGQAGVALEHAFVVPGAPQVYDGWADFGMATFGSGVDGEGILARFSLRLADGVDADTPVDVRLDMVSLGPSYTERDTIWPTQALTLANYCDAGGAPLARGLFVQPRERRAAYSAPGSGGLEDGSEGEVLLSARLLEDGAFVGGEAITWHIENAGPAAVYALARAAVPITPGGALPGFTLSDARGDAYLRLDSEPAPVFGATAVSLTACAERDGQPLCGDARVLWEDTVPTAVSEVTAARPAATTLDPCYPNPFNARVAIPVIVGAASAQNVRLEVFDLAGQRLAVLVDAPLAAGRHLFHWEPRDAVGRPLASGAYFCRLRSGASAQVRSVVLLR